MFSEDPILLPEIVDQIVLVTVHPASEREDEELQRRRHSLRLLGRLDQHRPSLGRFFAPYAVGRLNAPYGHLKAHSSPIVNRQAEDGAAVDTPGTRRLSGLILGDGGRYCPPFFAENLRT